MKSEKMRFALYTYDPCGDGGMMVDGLYYQRELEISVRIDPKIGAYTITDRILNRAIGERGLRWEGDEDYALYATNKKGEAVCKLRRIKDELVE